jgi:hypothetical protein
VSMFLEAISSLGSATINIPIAQLADSHSNIFSTIGISIPAVSTSKLASIGLFDHSVAENISKNIFESAGKTLTGHWMDCTGPYSGSYPQGVAVGWHRMANHHFLTDAFQVFKEPNLNVIDFYKHLATDVVTKNGIPMLPEGTVRALSRLLGVTPSKIMPWISLNCLDLGSGLFAVGHAGSNVASIMGGSAEWGLGYALNTFGVGGLEIAAGMQTYNPILVGSGAVDIACGTITAHNYYSQPFLCGVPVSDILNTAAVGVSFGAVLSLIEIFVNRENTTKLEKVKTFAERVSKSALLSSMSAISVPLSITTSFGLVGFSLAKKAAESNNGYIGAMAVRGGLSDEIDSYIADKYIGKEAMDRMMRHFNADEAFLSKDDKRLLSSLNFS